MRRPPIMASARRPRRGRKSWWDVCPVPATRRAFGLLDGAGSHPVATQRKTVPRFDGRLWRESGAAASQRPIFALVATAPDPRWRRRMAGKGATATVSPARVGLSAPIAELSSGACRVFRRPRRYRAPTRRNTRQAPLRSFRPIPPESYRESSPPTAATGGCPAGYLRVLLPHPAAGHPWPLWTSPASAAGSDLSSCRDEDQPRIATGGQGLIGCNCYRSPYRSAQRTGVGVAGARRGPPMLFVLFVPNLRTSEPGARHGRRGVRAEQLLRARAVQPVPIAAGVSYRRSRSRSPSSVSRSV